MTLQLPPSERPSISGVSTAAASDSRSSSIYDESSRRRRASEFHLPSGKKILVALPEEAARLRKKFHHVNKHNANTKAQNSESDGNDNGSTPTAGEIDDGDDEQIEIEVVVHGSVEHSGYLHEARRHHETRREHFKREFGHHYEAWESSRGALEEVKRQLDGLQDHEAPNALNANFDRFGYSATLKTYNITPGRSTPGSGAASLAESDSESGTLRNWDERSGGRTIRLFQRPVIKQYFHRGLLWRNSEQTEVMSFELFFELIYVGIIHYNGEHVADRTDALELGRFIITFIMSWQIWADVQQGVSWFEANDVLQRVYILFVIACLLGFTTNMTGAFNGEYDTYTQLTGFYIAARLATAVFYSGAAILLPLIRGFMSMQVVTILLPTALWIGSIFVDLPNRFILLALALVLDLLGPAFMIVPFAWNTQKKDTRVSKRLLRFYEFFPAMNIEHRVERTNAFVALVIGWAVVALLYQNAEFGFNAILGKAVIGLVQAFIFNWIYFEIDGENLHQHAIRRSAYSSAVWSMAHLPFICAYTLSSAAMSKIVIASDSPNSDPLSLEHDYAEKSKDYVNQGIRWAYCAGLGIALFSMSVIGMSHVHKVPPGMRVPKRLRMINRFAVCVIFFCLPLAKGLNSLELVSVTMGLMVWILLHEIWGKSCPEQTWCGRGGTEGKCPKLRYEARCSKKALEKALKESAEVGVAEVHDREKNSV